MSLSIPPFLWAAVALEQRRWLGYGVAVSVLLLCREDMAIAASCLGLFAITSHAQVRAGLITIAVSVAWLVFVKTVMMPDPSLLMENSEQSYEYGSYFAELAPHGKGSGEILVTLVTNPVYMVRHLFLEARVLFVLQLLVPLGLAPLAAGRGWVLLGYGMLFVLLASREAVFTLGFHYAATALPALIVLTPYGARRGAALA